MKTGASMSYRRVYSGPSRPPVSNSMLTVVTHGFRERPDDPLGGTHHAVVLVATVQ
ncbi:hypothetical protein [Kibdelosporangium philippinense]|uniref:hypothetical protein n=1 Tax=Kibdelosporangium philippinense TaxID=211113 RepID=UPI0036152341